MNINNVLYNLETLMMIFGVLIAGGFIAYKMKFADSWEGGVKLLLKTYWDWIKKIGKFLYEEFLGRSPDSQIINPALILTNKEAIELTNRFKNCPYVMPFLEKLSPNCNGCLLYTSSLCKIRCREFRRCIKSSCGSNGGRHQQCTEQPLIE